MHASSGSTDVSGLTLRLRPELAVFAEHEPIITACLTNEGERSLRLVMPGDGSFEGWRTPVIEWTFTPEYRTSVDSYPKFRMCGNVNRLTEKEVFTLRPGQTQYLTGILPTVYPGAAEFSASLSYVNDPTITFLGVPPPDEPALQLVRASDRCRVRSNEIKFVFDDHPRDEVRIWFPELVALLRLKWSPDVSCGQLIVLRAELQDRLRAIRAERGIEEGRKWVLTDERRGQPVVRCSRWCPEPEITVRGLILALERFHITSAETVSTLEQQWRKFRRQNGLDLTGALPRSKPLNGNR